MSIERICCSVKEAMEATGIGKTKIYALIGAGTLETVKVGDRRLVKIKSLMELLGEKWDSNPQMVPQMKSGFRRYGANWGGHRNGS